MTRSLARAALRAVTAFAGGMGVVWALASDASVAIGAGLACAAVSWWLPRRRQALARRECQRLLIAALPDAVDLLASAVGGGASTEIAVARVAEFADEPLRSLLLDAVAHGGEVGTGTRLCELDDALRPLGSLLRQSEDLGVPVAAALRLLAADARIRARAAARERAAAAAPKMLLVVGGLLAPASLLVVIGGQVLVLRDVAGPVLV